ncbi:MAG: hypothetical protein INR73_18620 [Williamsia sp.]|nr:hypothetical protein [Williamsia sp.]
MSSKRPLVPRFLRRFDHYLLLNKPDVWSARTHLVIYFGGLFIAALALVSFVMPDDPRSSSPAPYWIGYGVVISILALTVWLIYLLRFNVFKRYGHITPLSRLTTFILYFIAVGIIALIPMVMPYVESVRANKAYSDLEIINDVNSINTKICQLEYDSLPHKLRTDTILVVNQLPQHRSLPDEDEEEVEYDAGATYKARPRYRLVDTASLPGRITGADSSIRLNDSMYVLYASYDYTFVSSYQTSSFYMEGHRVLPEVYSNYDLYKKVIRDFDHPNRRAVRNELYKLLDKYNLEATTPGWYEYDEQDLNGAEQISQKYNLYTINRNIDNVSSRKLRWRDENGAFIIRLWYYITLGITLLVFVYRHSTRKTFFLSLLTAVILSILTSLFAAYFNQRESSMYVWLMAYIALFFGISLFAFRNKVRSGVAGIGINLFVLLVASLPLCMVSYYYSRLEEKNRNLINPPPIDYAWKYQLLWYAELAGSLLLLILLATYIQRVYRKWYALPEE